MSTAQYALSAVLALTSLPRCGALVNETTLLVGDQNGGITQFVRASADTNTFVETATAANVHNGIVFTVEPVPAQHPTFPHGSIISGGGDREISVSLDDGTLLAKLSGHTGAVGSLVFTADGTVLSGGWDGTIRAWRGTEEIFCDKSHLYATCLALIPSASGADAGTLVSGSGNKELHIDAIVFDDSNAAASASAGAGAGSGFSLRRIATVKDAHNHLIRRVIPHPLGVLSCGNDGWIKLWAVDGSPLSAFQAFFPGPDQPEFIYDCALLPNGHIAAAGDDKTVCFFELGADGESARKVATLRLPQPARELVVLPDGDVIAIGTAGVFVLSDKPARAAAEDTVNVFNALFAPQGASSIDMSTLPMVDVLLQKPVGTAPKTLIVNDGGRPMVYVWSEDRYEWELQGEAIGTKPKGEGADKPKTLFNGVEYDYVVPVDLGPGQPTLQLPFNKDDDPETLAAAFIAKHGLPVDYLAEIVNFISPLVDMDAVRARRADDAATAEATRLRQCPVWRTTGYLGVSTCKAAVMLGAITRRNAELAAAPETAGLALTAAEIAVLGSVVIPCADAATLVEPPVFTMAARDVTVKLLHWPSPQLAPVLDLLRVLLAHRGANAALVNPMVTDDLFVFMSQTLFAQVNAATEPDAPVGNVVLALQALSNWVVYRPPAVGETPGSATAVTPESVSIFLTFVAELAATALRASGPNAPRFRAEGVRVLYNLTVYLGRTRGMQQSPLLMRIFSDLLEVVPPAIAAGTLPNPEAQYQGIAALVSIATYAPALARVKEAVALATKTSGGDPALAAMRAMASDLGAKMKTTRELFEKTNSPALTNLAKDIKVVFGV